MKQSGAIKDNGSELGYIRSLYSLGLYEKAMPKELSWEEKLRLTKESGFDFLEMSIDETDEKLGRLDYNNEQIQEILDTMNRQQVYIRTMCLSGHRKFPIGSIDATTRSKGLEIMAKAIDLANVLGIRIIQLAGYDVYYEESSDETKALFAENLAKCVAMAAKKGIVLGFETMETEFMNTMKKSMQYVSTIASPYLGVYPDIGNLTNAAVLYGHSVLDDLLLGKGHVVATHLKETVPNVFREVPFGTGHTDFTNCIRVLYEQGVCMFTGEFWYIGSEQWKQDLSDASSFLRCHIDGVLNKATSR